MAEFSITTENVIDTPWLSTKNIAVGQVPRTLGTPDLFALIEKDGNPYLRADLYVGEETICFQEMIIWKAWAVIGYGDHVHFISTTHDTAKSIELDCYFGSLYPYDDFLLAASGMSLYKIDERADLIWKSADLGIDGVLVHDISDNVIFGEGEWDPPGGWKPFRINCSFGLEIK
jgi:hypothetical protein